MGWFLQDALRVLLALGSLFLLYVLALFVRLGLDDIREGSGCDGWAVLLSSTLLLLPIALMALRWAFTL